MTKQDQLNLVDRDSQFSNTESKINCQNNSSDNRQRSKGHSNIISRIKVVIVGNGQSPCCDHQNSSNKSCKNLKQSWDDVTKKSAKSKHKKNYQQTHCASNPEETCINSPKRLLMSILSGSCNNENN